MNTGQPLHRPEITPQQSTSGPQHTTTAEAGKERIKEQSRETAEELKHQARETAEQVKQQGQQMMRQQKEQLVQRLHHCSAASRKAAEQLRTDDDPMLAGYAEAIADQLDRGSDYIRNRDGREMIRDVGDLARRQPEMFFGGMFIAGLCLARFLKSSSKRTHEVDRGTQFEQQPSWTDQTYGMTGPGLVEDRPVAGAPAAPVQQPSHLQHSGQ